jgi:cytochrome c-type biogenesis protein CcmE
MLGWGGSHERAFQTPVVAAAGLERAGRGHGALVFFFSPSQVAAKEAPVGRSFRVGGLVQEGSVVREPQGLTVRFVVTDTAQTVPVSYTGLLPDLFNEGKGVVAQGRLGADGVFRADQVLAKHDENYMAPEAAAALAQAKPGAPLQGATTLVNKP